MAIDTQNKRRSVQGYTLTPVLPVADNSIAALDREMVGWLYAGIAAGAVIATFARGDVRVFDAAQQQIASMVRNLHRVRTFDTAAHTVTVLERNS